MMRKTNKSFPQPILFWILIFFIVVYLFIKFIGGPLLFLLILGYGIYVYFSKTKISPRMRRRITSSSSIKKKIY